MPRSLAFASFLLTCLSTCALAQFQSQPYCNAGLHPDGYVDFTLLPAPPAAPSSAPIVLTAPVQGVPGLNVQITIPSGYYYVFNGALILNGQSPDNQLLQLQFNKPVVGIGLRAKLAARGSNFSLQINDGPSSPDGFTNTVTNNVLGYFTDTTSLEAVQVNSSDPPALSTAILVGDPRTQVSNLRIQSASYSGSNMVPKQGLQQWLMSESASDDFAGTASSWPDQSGNGHDATQTVTANQPFQTAQDGRNCKGGFEFFGNQSFNFNLPIAGWDQMTIFMVAKSLADPPNGSYASQSAAIFWNENSAWGNTFLNPYQTSVPFRFGTNQVNNQPIYTRPATIGQDFTVTRAVHNGTTDSLYVDGLLTLTQGGKSAVLHGTTGAGYIGQGLNNTYFNGEISEILIYNRVLSANENAAVESYLRNKFGTR